MRNKPKTQGQKIADTMTMETFMNELNSSFVGKLFEGENGEPDTILLMQKYLDEGRGSSLEQILMSRAIGELVKLRDQVIALKEELLDTLEGAGVLQEKIERLETNPPQKSLLNICRDDGIYTIEDSALSIRNILNICREDEQNQLAEMLNLQEEANFNNEQFNKSNMK